jgi:hypothetical protein
MSPIEEGKSRLNRLVHDQQAGCSSALLDDNAITEKSIPTTNTVVRRVISPVSW